MRNSSSSSQPTFIFLEHFKTTAGPKLDSDQLAIINHRPKDTMKFRDSPIATIIIKEICITQCTVGKFKVKTELTNDLQFPQSLTLIIHDYNQETKKLLLHEHESTTCSLTSLFHELHFHLQHQCYVKHESHFQISVTFRRTSISKSSLYLRKGKRECIASIKLARIGGSCN